MKNLFKLFIGMFCCVAALSLTSCLNSDDDSSAIDAATQKSYMSVMSGYYSGKLRFYKPKTGTVNSIERYDSLSNATCVLSSDSTFTLRSNDTQGRYFINCLDSAIVNTGTYTKYAALSEALRNCTSEGTFYASYCIPSTSYLRSETVWYFVSSMMVEKKLNYDGADHYVYFMFGTPTGYSAVWNKSGSVSLFMLLTGIYISDTQKTAWTLSNSDALDSSYRQQNLYVTFGN